MMTIISALTISLFLVEQDCPFIAILGGKADICERMCKLSIIIIINFPLVILFSFLSLSLFYFFVELCNRSIKNFLRVIPGAIVLLFVITSSYLWFVVYSTYKSLELKKGLMHEVHTVKKYALPIAEGPKMCRVSATKPYEV